MSSAINDLQRAIVSGNQSLSQLLRQTKLIAVKLGVKDIEQWVNHELNGYPKDVSPPAYRKYFAHSLETYNPYLGQWEFSGNLNIDAKANQPIAELENYSKGQQVAFPCPKQIPLQNDSGLSIIPDSPQRFIVMGSQFKRIIDAVTNELLNWTMQLEKRGIKGDDMNFDEEDKQSAGNMVFNIGSVQGNVGNVSHSQAVFNNYRSLHQTLIDNNVPMRERHELEGLMEELKTASPEQKPSLIQRGEDWIIKNKEFLGTSVELVTKAIMAAAGNQ